MKVKSILLPFIPFILVVSFGEIASSRAWLPAFLFPAPSQVWATFLGDLGSFRTAFDETLLASGVGLALSVLVGISFALMLSFSDFVRATFYPYAIFFQTVPIIAIAPLLVIWLGYGMPTVIASAFIVSVFPVIANSVQGLLGTDPSLLNVFKMVNASRLQTLFKLQFPYALPQILGGIKIAAGLSVIGAIVGEFISGSGLGGLVDAARNQQRVDRVFAAVILAALLGILFLAFIQIISRLLLRNWKEI